MYVQLLNNIPCSVAMYVRISTRICTAAVSITRHLNKSFPHTHKVQEKERKCVRVLAILFAIVAHGRRRLRCV